MESYSVQAVLSAVDTNFSSAMARADKLTNSVQRSFLKASKNIAKYSAIIGVAIAGFSIKAGASFEAGMKEVQAITKATASDMEKLSAKAKEMGATTKFSATDSAAALKYMGMAGWKSEQMLKGLPGVMNLAAASGEDLALVSDIVTDSMTAFNMGADEASHFADVLANASTNANTNVSMLGESFKYVAPIAGTLGYNIEDVAVALGTMANSGIKSSMAGTALRRALTNLSAPTAQMSSKMDELGISMTNSDGSMKSLGNVMKNLRSSFKGLSKEQKLQAASTIFGQQAAAGMLTIIEAEEAEFNKLTDAMYNSNGAAEKMAKTMNDNLKGDFTLFKSALESLGIKIYEVFQGDLRKAVQWITKFVGKISDAVDSLAEFRKSLKGTGGMAKTQFAIIRKKLEPIAPLLATIGAGVFAVFSAPKLIKFAQGMSFVGKSTVKTVGKLGVFTSKFGPLNSIVSNTVGVLGLLSKAALGILGPAVLVGGALAGLGLLYSQFGEQIDNMIAVAIEKGPQIISKLVEGITSKIPELINKGAELVSKLADVIVANFPVIVDGGIKLVESLVSGIGNNSGSLIESGVKIIGVVITSIIGALPKLLKIGMELLKNLTEGMLDNMPLIVTTISEIITTLVNSFVEALPTLIETGMEILINLVTGVIQALPELIPVAVEVINTLVSGILDNLPSLISSGLDLILALLTGIVENLPLIATAAIDIIGNLISGLIENLPDLIMAGLSFIGALVMGIIENLPTIVSTGWDIVVALGEGILGLLGSLVEAGWELIKALAQGAWDGVKNFFTGIADSIWNAITGNGEVVEKVKETNQAIVTDSQIANSKVSNSSREMANNVKASAVDTNEAVTRIFGQAKTNAINSSSQMKSGVVSNAKGMNSDVRSEMSSLRAGTQTEMGAMSSNTQEYLSRINSDFASKYGNIKTSVGTSLQGVSNTSSTELSNTERAFKATSINNANHIQQMMGQVQITTNSGLNRMVSSWNRATESVGSAVSGMASNIRGIFYSISGSMSSAGYNAGMGFYYGLSASAGAIYGLAYSIASSVAAIMRSALSIHSPSRVTTEIGEHTGGGFVNGIANKINKAKEVAKDLALAGVPNISDSVAEMHKGLNSNLRMEHVIDGTEGDSATFNLNLDGKSYRGHVEDISDMQEKSISLELAYLGV